MGKLADQPSAAGASRRGGTLLAAGSAGSTVRQRPGGLAAARSSRAGNARTTGSPSTAPAPMPPAPGCVGIIVALPEPLATQLRDWRLSFGDALAKVIPPHITLVTTTPVADWEATARHVRRVAKTQLPFRVGLKGTGSFRPVSPVVYLNLVDGFDECVRLHQKLQLGPLEKALPFPYHPHITVAHDISADGMDQAQETLQDFEASFPVSSMGLYEHDSSGVWLLREELGFGGKPENTAAGSGKT
ncbi:MAG TPA: 2'-5' RNA ligase family protein [Micrococcaceae bacterium]|nr:2'-5' RNA ligase family protein [Micrococcaceae bacterium]